MEGSKDFDESELRSFIESGLITEKYEISKDNFPSIIEGRSEEEVLKEVMRYVTPSREVNSEVKNWVEKMLKSPVKIQLDAISKDNVLSKLVENEICEIYLVLKGCPVDKPLWFKSPVSESESLSLSEINSLIEELFELAEELPEFFKEFIKPQLNSLRDVSKSPMKVESKSKIECTHPRKYAVPIPDMRDLGRGVLYICPDCGKHWRV
ncbi:MAG: hypothetical protein QXK89_10095 [Candidatus Bathyarchaeia archaeon]